MEYRYFSCGHSHCPLCQGNKRQAWYERVEAGLLKVPYCHITFTLPHELNGLCRLHPSIMYGMLFRVAWQTLRELCAEPGGVEGLPGMTAVLHTWGSDLKHHVHLHCLVTFGGLDQSNGRWQWPKSKLKLLRYRPIRNRFRANFLGALKRWMKVAGPDIYHQSYEVLTAGLITKTWVVNQQPPTMDATVINAYLSRYICRIGISDKRLKYDPITQQVSLEYNDYRKQQSDQPPPTAMLSLPPLLAMDKILQHLLPPHFHRTRHYGLHAPNTRKRLAGQLQAYVKSAPSTVLVVLRLLKAMLQLSTQYACQQCGSIAVPTITSLPPDHDFKYRFLQLPQRAPPAANNPNALHQQAG